MPSAGYTEETTTVTECLSSVYRLCSHIITAMDNNHGHGQYIFNSDHWAARPLIQIENHTEGVSLSSLLSCQTCHLRLMVIHNLRSTQAFRAQWGWGMFRDDECGGWPQVAWPYSLWRWWSGWRHCAILIQGACSETFRQDVCTQWKEPVHRPII